MTDYTGGKPLPPLGTRVLTHRWRDGERDEDLSTARVIAHHGIGGSAIVRFDDGHEAGAFGYDLTPIIDTEPLRQALDAATATVQRDSSDAEIEAAWHNVSDLAWLLIHYVEKGWATDE